MSRALKLLFLMVATVATGTAQTVAADDKPTESVHRKGPDGLEGWTLEWPLPDDSSGERYPMTLVIARNGRVIRQVEGSGFVWNWLFLPGGKEIAYQSGPMHFSMTCVRMNIRSGKILENYNCYDYAVQPEPSWVVDLDQHHPDW